MARITVYRLNLCVAKFQYEDGIESKDAVQSIDYLGDRFGKPTIMMPSMIRHHCSDGPCGEVKILEYKKAD